MKFIGNSNEYLRFETLEQTDYSVFKEIKEESLTVLWFQENDNEFVIDGKIYTFHKNQIIFLTEFHKVTANHFNSTRFLRFNRTFYCVIDHDAEVGCKGLLFYGASQLPIINISKKVLLQFETLWVMFKIEMQSKDNLQIGMLQMMLKRYLILCTRLFKIQDKYPEEKIETDIIRDFNFLVEQHFKTKHTVTEYADLLNKSPKTLSNLFSKIGSKTPLQYIQERKMLAARRSLRYTNMQIQEIAYEIGYDDLQTFSRFFKNQEGVSPTVYKENT
ncbi:MAG: AraC family transcriptional regulator [Flavobacteriaceae bacterium]|nr:MAG: AraC family transcriptional regulator [Flavobacteriaceae bacterium]